MNKFEILQAVADDTLSRTDAARRLGLSERGVQRALFTYEAHLPFILDKIAQLQRPLPTKPRQTAIKRDLARRLKVGYNQVNRLLRVAKVTVPAPEIVEKRAKIREKEQKRRVFVAKTVKSVALGTLSDEIALERLGIGARQLARHLSRLIAPTGMTVREFRKLPRNKRREWLP